MSNTWGAWLFAAICMVCGHGVAQATDVKGVDCALKCTGVTDDGYETWAVLIDQETGFSYVKTSVGWRFIKKLSPVQVETAFAGAQDDGYETWAVLIDRETGFSYVKTSAGWRFIKKLSPVQVETAFATHLEQEICRPGLLLSALTRHSPSLDRQVSSQPNSMGNQHPTPNS